MARRRNNNNNRQKGLICIEIDESKRKIHVIDIENITGLQLPSLSAGEAFWRDYPELRMRSGDSVYLYSDPLYVAYSSKKAFVDVAFDCRGGRQICKPGRDGADHALLGALNAERLERYNGVVIVSGDGIFAPTVKKLKSEGVHVTVVSRPESLAKELRRAASEVVPFRISLLPAA